MEHVTPEENSKVYGIQHCLLMPLEDKESLRQRSITSELNITKKKKILSRAQITDSPHAILSFWSYFKNQPRTFSCALFI